MTRSPCNQKNIFGADIFQHAISRSSCSWKAGSRFGELLEQTLKQNFARFGIQEIRPSWLMTTWHAIWNSNDHNADHGIEPHSDLSATYFLGPITSFSFGRSGVLTLTSKIGKSLQRKLLQEDGYILIISGKFQAEYLHGIPNYSSWENLMSNSGFTALKEWEKQGIELEVEGHKRWNDTNQDFRYSGGIVP